MTMSVDEVVDEVLRKAADIIEERGWCQRTFTDGEKVCTATAIFLASGGNALAIRDGISDLPRTPLFKAACTRLARHVGLYGYSTDPEMSGVCIWNNTRNSADEITNGLREAANRS